MMSGAARYLGHVGIFWTASSYMSTLSTYSLYFNTTNILTSYNNVRWVGFMVGCAKIWSCVLADRKAMPPSVDA